MRQPSATSPVGEWTAVFETTWHVRVWLTGPWVFRKPYVDKRAGLEEDYGVGVTFDLSWCVGHDRSFMSIVETRQQFLRTDTSFTMEIFSDGSTTFYYKMMRTRMRVNWSQGFLEPGPNWFLGVFTESLPFWFNFQPRIQHPPFKSRLCVGHYISIVFTVEWEQQETLWVWLFLCHFLFPSSGKITDKKRATTFKLIEDVLLDITKAICSFWDWTAHPPGCVPEF